MARTHSDRPYVPLLESDPLAAYAAAIVRAHRPLPRDTERALSLRIGSGDGRAILALAEYGLPFVMEVCREYADRGLNPIELVTEGNLGLLRAAAAFPASGAEGFIAYSEWWIRRALDAAAAERGEALALTPPERVHLRSFAAALRKLSRGTGRWPSDAELELETGLPAESIRRSRLALDALRASGSERLPHPHAGRSADFAGWLLARWNALAAALAGFRRGHGSGMGHSGIYGLRAR